METLRVEELYATIVVIAVLGIGFRDQSAVPGTALDAMASGATRLTRNHVAMLRSMGVTSVFLLVTAAARRAAGILFAGRPGGRLAAGRRRPFRRRRALPKRALLKERPLRGGRRRSRTAQELKDVPANITVLDETEIAATAGLTTDAVLHRVPGITMLRQQSSLVSSPATQETNVRNLGSGSARTLVLLDGVPLNDSAGGQVYWSRVPPASIDRVEVIRGAGSNVWGNRAMAGVISLFTKRPTERALDVTALLGERNTSDVTLFGAQTFGSVALSIATRWLR